MVQIEGQLVEIIYQNEANGYTVGILSNDHEEITIVGTLPAIKEGENLQVKGRWTRHPNYGRQLEVQEYQVIQPATEEGMISYLSSGVIPGIGEKMARRIVEHFGSETFEIMQMAPERLTEVPGIGELKASLIAESFREQREQREVILFLSQYQITPALAIKIYKQYGERTISILQENPYRLGEIGGIGFKRADQIAAALGIPRNSMYRVLAAVKYALGQFHGEGHTYAPKDLLVQKVRELTGCDPELIESGIQHLALEQQIHMERNREGGIHLYAMMYYYAEAYSCRKLISLIEITFNDQGIDIDQEIQLVEEEGGIQLAANQKEAVRQALLNSVMVITGGPGTGKTTTINTLIKLFEKMNKKILLAAPTGRAAKRMTEATGMEAKTLHRLLEIAYGDEDRELSFQRDEDNPLEADVVIVDETSMVDILLFHSLLKAIAPGTRLILVGDVDQLPSVGPGNVLKNIIESKIVKVVRLNEIFRQAQESMIVVNAHRINRGEVPLCNVKDKDFFLISRNNKEGMLQSLLDLVKHRLPKHYGLDPLRDIQVLSPMKKGTVGTHHLNRALQDVLNPQAPWKREKEYGERRYRMGDKVMQIKNNYTLQWISYGSEGVVEDRGEGVFNGDIGYIHSIDLELQEMTVLFDETRLVTYGFSQLDELELAYCVTVHKSQGSEFPVVVMPVTWGPPMLLTRNLLYTAVTRAKKLVVMVGREVYLEQMVKNDQIVQRYSGLGDRLKYYYDFQQIE